MAAAQSYRDLDVYQEAFALQQRVFDLSKEFPREERYSLTSQLRDASRSVGGNIAEAWRKRRYSAHFVSKLTDADAELAETQHWIETAMACAYIDKDVHKDLFDRSERIGRMLGAMIARPQAWCAKAR